MRAGGSSPTAAASVDLLGSRFNQSAKLRNGFSLGVVFPFRQMPDQSVAKILELFQLSFCLRQGGFRHVYDATTRLLSSTAQGHDAPDFIQTEAERLRFPDEAQLLHRCVPINAIAGCAPVCPREESAPFIVTNGVGSHSRELSELSDQEQLLFCFDQRLSDAACSRVTAPSNAILPSTTTVGIARTP